MESTAQEMVQLAQNPQLLTLPTRRGLKPKNFGLIQGANHLYEAFQPSSGTATLYSREGKIQTSEQCRT